MDNPVRAHGAGRITILGVVLASCLVNLVVGWPGILTPDSQDQLAQAVAGRYDDWHPPFMAMLWRALGATPPAMLIVQVVLHWAGIWTFAEGVRRVRPTRWVWAVVAVGATPIALKYTGVIQKDSLLAGFLLLAFGLSLSARAAAGLPFGLAAMLCRANGVFALPPLLFALRRKPMSLLSTVAASLALAVVLVPVIGTVNARLPGVAPSGVLRSVQLFDMAGIVHLSGDASVMPQGTRGAVRCYTPLFLDAIEPCMPPYAAMKPSMTREWLAAIGRHPLAYARHRLSHFNRTIFFLVPPMQQCVDAPALHACDFSARGRVRDAVQKNALLWPVTWLVAGLLLLTGTLNPASRALVLSGLLYGGAYVVVGVASDFRYFYWTELAIQLGIVLQLALVGRVERGRTVVAGVALVWTAGYAARLLLA